MVCFSSKCGCGPREMSRIGKFVLGSVACPCSLLTLWLATDICDDMAKAGLG